MKILFVSSGNKKEEISSLVLDQGKSIESFGFELTYFTIKGEGFWGYFKNIFILRKYLKDNKFDIIHAHYSLSGFVAALSGAKPLVVSLMGSDVKQKWFWRQVIILFNFLFWDACIVKGADMQKSLALKNLTIIPNGVNLKLFSPIDKKEAQKYLKWDQNKQHILFAANPDRYEKNYNLTKKSFDKIANKNTELHFLMDVLKEEMPYYYSAADVVMLTSLWEGSPNVIKEAMACCRPIVATDVGDIRWLLGSEEGHYLISFNPDDVATKLDVALTFCRTKVKTMGRTRIIDLGIDSETTAMRIVDIYNIVKK